MLSLRARTRLDSAGTKPSPRLTNRKPCLVLPNREGKSSNRLITPLLLDHFSHKPQSGQKAQDLAEKKKRQRPRKRLEIEFSTDLIHWLVGEKAKPFPYLSLFSRFNFLAHPLDAHALSRLARRSQSSYSSLLVFTISLALLALLSLSSALAPLSVFSPPRWLTIHCTHPAKYSNERLAATLCSALELVLCRTGSVHAPVI